VIVDIGRKCSETFAVSAIVTSRKRYGLRRGMLPILGSEQESVRMCQRRRETAPRRSVWPCTERVPNSKDCQHPRQRPGVIWTKPLWATLPGQYQFEITLKQPPILPPNQSPTQTLLRSPGFRVKLTDATKPPMKKVGPHP
jgi:hypothetical protein